MEPHGREEEQNCNREKDVNFAKEEELQKEYVHCNPFESKIKPNTSANPIAKNLSLQLKRMEHSVT